jgi:hypothetical protein
MFDIAQSYKYSYTLADKKWNTSINNTGTQARSDTDPVYQMTTLLNIRKAADSLQNKPPYL